MGKAGLTQRSPRRSQKTPRRSQRKSSSCKSTSALPVDSGSETESEDEDERLIPIRGRLVAAGSASRVGGMGASSSKVPSPHLRSSSRLEKQSVPPPSNSTSSHVAAVPDSTQDDDEGADTGPADDSAHRQTSASSQADLNVGQGDEQQYEDQDKDGKAEDGGGDDDEEEGEEEEEVEESQSVYQGSYDFGSFEVESWETLPDIVKNFRNMF